MLGISFLTLDLLIIILIGLVFFFWAFYAGKKVLARFILTFYPTTLIFQNFPYVSFDSDVMKVGFFVVIFVSLFLLLKKNARAGTIYGGTRKTIDGIVLSISAIILLLTVYYHLVPIGSFYTFTVPFAELFTQTLPLGAWMILPLLGIIVTNKSEK